ncbi:hypothetical protein GDO86_016432 [Hymenochirus boettgeri]|uniref:Olfactory receptor n=1 Tax=Hymenochirus boettgeri TaxID=247094 RepID=A0A8T2JZL8_9PIPI|nr:hypothetical protein GDO86_016432 [Hymenochirus boettgeri]
MRSENQTFVSYFTFLGLTDVREKQIILFAFFLLVYLISIIGNLCIMVITICTPNLHTPMYFFLWNLSLLDMCHATVTVPKTLFDLFASKKAIPFGGCMSQMLFFHFFGSSEIVLLSVMSYDRYVAIGNPLKYTTIMTPKVCVPLALISWTIGFFHSLIHTVMTARLPFCGPNMVKHFFCDIKPVLTLACTDITFNLKLLIALTGGLALTTFILTLIPYIFIGKCLLKIKTAEGRKRALSTCSAHLTVVFLQYGTVIFCYMRPSSENTLDQDRAAAVVITAITPALNPIIYSLRNKDIRKGMLKMIKRYS